MNRALYCYFGLLGDNDIDIPGHSFYQLPLISTLSKHYGIDIFDFYSYLPTKYKINTPFVPYNVIDQFYFDKLIDVYNISLNDVIFNVSHNKYDLIILKARFRNKSTLSKKWFDTLKFELLLDFAKSRNVDFIILDTDLSIDRTQFSNVTTIKKLDTNTIMSYMLFHKKEKNNNILYYGNIDTSNYNSGQGKSDMLLEFFYTVPSYDTSHKYIVVSKTNPKFKNTYFIKRTNRRLIYTNYKNSTYSLNITKPLYTQKHFIPARIFESIMHYSIPISYDFNFLLPYLSFSNLMEYFEILKYLDSATSSDINKILLDLISVTTIEGGKFDEQ